MSATLGDRLATQAAAEAQGVTQQRDASRKLTVLEWVKNPALLEADPRSFILGVLYFAQLGLELGPLGLAYLTGPFKMESKGGIKEVVPVIGYKGLAQLAYRSEKVELVDAVSVHAG